MGGPEGHRGFLRSGGRVDAPDGHQAPRRPHLSAQEQGDVRPARRDQFANRAGQGKPAEVEPHRGCDGSAALLRVAFCSAFREPHGSLIVSPVTKSKPLPSSTRTVVVACQIPTGMALQLQVKQPRVVDGKDGAQMVDFWVKRGKVWYVHGPAYPVAPPKGYPRAPIIVGGYALTSGIPADFWEQWLEQNKNSDYVQPREGAEHGSIFAYPDMESTSDAAAEQA